MLRPLAVFVALWLPASALALGAMSGYGKYKFGMTYEQVTNVASSKLGCHLRELREWSCQTAAAAPPIAGIPIAHAFQFFDDELFLVSLLFEFPSEMEPSERLGKFSEVVKLLAAKYGKPDAMETPGERIADITYGGAEWTAQWKTPTGAVALQLHVDSTYHQIYMSVDYIDPARSKKYSKFKRAEEAEKSKAELERL